MCAGFTRAELVSLSKNKLIDIILQQQELIQKLKDRDQASENELLKYKNSNTPPSANKHLKPNTKGVNAKKKKRGPPKGHEGKTRIQRIDEKQVIDADECPQCGSHELKDKKILKKVVEDIPEPSEPKTVEHEIHKKECLKCGYQFIPPHNRVPLRGKFGLNLILLTVLIKFQLRGVLRKTALFLAINFKLNLTGATINSIIKRVRTAVSPNYEQMKEKIRESKRIYIDETSFSVGGNNEWVWIFRTETEVFLIIRPSRGSDVIKEILPTDYGGVVICDCWRAYDYLQKLQRCWAHLLRKAKTYTNTLAGKNMYHKLKKLFKKIKRFNRAERTEAERLKKYNEMMLELKEITSHYSKYEVLSKLLTYIGNNFSNWFTCIKYSGVEPTNNYAEQILRETVLVRKIIGAFRSDEGKKNYEIIASVLSTWQLKGLDIIKELKTALINNLCLS
jgi:Zn ribbon nucleic-acid-binding protein